jgi:hypothetical protein
MFVIYLWRNEGGKSSAGDVAHVEHCRTGQSGPSSGTSMPFAGIQIRRTFADQRICQVNWVVDKDKREDAW